MVDLIVYLAQPKDMSELLVILHPQQVLVTL